MLLLLGHALSASAMPHEGIKLKMNDKINLAMTENISLPKLNSRITYPSVPAVAEYISTRTPSASHDIAPAAIQNEIRNPQPEVKKQLAIVATLSEQAAQTTSKNPSRSAAFRLKLSGGMVDESRIGKISAEERAFLLAWKRLFDADDRSANFLSIQNQRNQFQGQSGGVTLKLSELDISPIISTLSATSTPVPAPVLVSAPVSLATANTRGNRSNLTNYSNQPEDQENKLNLQNGLFIAAGLLLVTLALWAGSHFYALIRQHVKIESQQRTEPVMNTQDNAIFVVKTAMESATQPSQPDALLSLQEMENFLADFDPKRYGSVNEFLTWRNGITPEQLIGWSKYRPSSRNFTLRVVGAPALQV